MAGKDGSDAAAEPTEEIPIPDVDAHQLDRKTRQALVRQALGHDDQDHQGILERQRERFNRAGVQPRAIEIRFDDLTVEASAYVGSRSQPNILNFYRNIFEGVLLKLHLLKSSKRKVTLLSHLNGVLMPGKMTLLLGPPGGGKSTLLKALAGALEHSSSMKKTGSVTYNGQTFKQFVPEQTATYVHQTDLHLAEMTVRETFDFGARVQGAGFRGEEEADVAAGGGNSDDKALESYMKAAALPGKRETVVTDYIIRILGMEVCADTPIGNEMIRGISGGQKKRVTLGEKLVGPKQVLLLDSISTGLDSATAFLIVKALRDFCHLREATVLISLLQPTPETYNLFDDLILMAEGRMIYHGPIADAEHFFIGTGFRCPPRTDMPDFLQEVTSKKDQQQYWAGDKAYAFVPVSAFEAAYRASGLGQSAEEAVKAPQREIASGKDPLVHTHYSMNTIQAFKALMYREWLLMQRNSFVYIFKAVQTAIVAVIAATLFIRTHIHSQTFTDANLIAGFLFFTMVQLYFSGIAEITFAIERLPVYYRQRERAMYPSWAFVLPTTILRIPVSIVESLIWTVITYWVVGLSNTPGRVFVYWLTGALVHNMAVSLFRALGAIARNLTTANALGTMAMLLMVMLGGYVLTKQYVHPWYIWVYWINPYQYGQRAFFINEFTAQRWLAPDSPGPRGNGLGNYLLETKDIPNHYWWVWVSNGFNAAAIVFFNVIIIFCNQYLPPAGGEGQAVISEEELDESAEAVGSFKGATPGQVAVELQQGAEGADNRNSESFRRRNTGASSRRLSAEGRKKALASFRASNRNISGRGGAGGDSKKGQASQGSLGSVDPDADKGMVLPFDPIIMTFGDVHYWVPCPPDLDHSLPSVMDKNGKPMLELLRGISGAFRPGFMTCLMGVSGAGKTTLMDVLAGRKTGGIVEGDIRINGFPKVQETFTRVSGYVEQTDTHNGFTTVREALQFSARLRIEGAERQVLEAFVEEIMELVELTSLQELVVGGSLSEEQMRRLSIAVELVSNPSIVFMDEPTSGLDARAAAVVIRVVRNIVNTGRTIVCTIHQPSTAVFEQFDELLLIKQGGRVIFSGLTGKESSHLVEHFQSVEGVPKIAQGINPATWMLEISGRSTENNLGVDFSEIYDRSPLAKRTQDTIDSASQPKEGTQPLAFGSVYAQNFMSQMWICMQRSWITAWRNEDYNATRVYFTIILALLSGTIYWKLGSNTTTEQTILNAMGAVFISSTFLAIVQCVLVQPVISVERAVMYRERAAGMYNVMAWFFGLVAVECFYLLIQSILFTCIVYFSAGFEKKAHKFFWFIFFQYTSLGYWVFYGALAVAATPNLIGAAVISAAFYGQSYLFAGFIMAEQNTPGWWVWVYWFNPVQWTLRGLLASQFGDIDDQTVELLTGGTSTPKRFINDRLGFKESWLGYTVIVLVAWCLVLIVGVGFALQKLNFQNK
ncbi:hypothetical protein WJX73_000657 [Symbiochloris irregularis]|uniref:ABC transporter domain-containing protein n=1 Tax=Symbiochloris irregularis TaxID=706552 RepID=A0AAW1NWE5_9CHLO